MLWTPSTEPPGNVVGGSFVAFLTGEQADDLADPGQAWIVDLEGLWVACDDTAPTKSVLVQPVGSAWEEVLADGISLDELWERARSSAYGFGEPIGASFVVDGAAIYDVRLRDGGRFRLSLPQALAADLTLIEPPAPDPITLQSSTVGISISFGLCWTEGSTDSRFGSAVVMADETVRVCGRDPFLTMDVVSAVDFSRPALELFDLQPIQFGSRYWDARELLTHESKRCSNCDPNGPMVYPDDNVVVNRSGPTSVTALDLDTLEELWTLDTGGFDTLLHGGRDNAFLDVVGGPFLSVDPATGNETWRISRDVGERNAGWSGHGEDVWFLRSTFASEGDDRAPILRRVNPTTGEVIWRATGRIGAEWQFIRPTVLNNLVFMIDVTDFPQVPVEILGGTLQAFDIFTGNVVWITDLESPTEAFSFDLVELLFFGDGVALVVATIDGDLLRVDPNNGNILWRTRIARGRIDGTASMPGGDLVISIDSDLGQILIDHTTGEIVPAADDNDGDGPPGYCRALVGDEPWITLFSRSQVELCVVAAEFQNVQVWNKGFEAMTVAWPDSDRTVTSDDHFDTGPIGEVLTVGPNEIESTPYPMPTIWVMPKADNPSAEFNMQGDSFGPVEPGMTIDAAAEALGLDVAIDPNLLPGPTCWAAVIANDPYSPTFVAVGVGDGTSEVIEIIGHGPDSTRSLEYNPCLEDG